MNLPFTPMLKAQPSIASQLYFNTSFAYANKFAPKLSIELFTFGEGCAYFGGSRIHCSALCSAAVGLGGSFTKDGASRKCPVDIFSERARLPRGQVKHKAYMAGFILLRKMVLSGGSFTKKASSLCDDSLFLCFTNPDASIGFGAKKKPLDFSRGFLRSGSRTRTCDLRVMSPTSYLLLYPAMWTANIQRF